MQKYIPLHCHSTFSLLDGLSKPAKIADRLEELALDGCAITDHGGIQCAIQFQEALDKKKLKSILGCELYLSYNNSIDKSTQNRKLFHQVILAKNIKGWHELLKITSDSNALERYYYRPRLDFKYFEECPTKNIIAFSGHLGSHLADCALIDKQYAINRAEYLRDLFGKDNFWIEIQLIDSKQNETARIVGEVLREVGQITKIPCVATADSHYCKKEDAEDQRILICTSLQTTFSKIQQCIDNEEEIGLDCFFKSNNFHIPSTEEMGEFHTEEELINTTIISSQIEAYKLNNKPILPPFTSPNGLNEKEYLRYLCREGWKKKLQYKLPKDDISKYADRVKHELEVLQNAKLSGYFLIVHDIIQYAKSNNWLTGAGRGSAAGCLVSYLLDITKINPIPYNLLFERFYNAGRNTTKYTAFPDIDIDVPVNKRDKIIDYIKNKYGLDKVSQIATYQTMQGRSAIKNVLRVHGNISFDEMNHITEYIPDEAKIADDLQEMKEEFGESSIIKWALKNRPNKFKEWCYIDKNDILQGPLAKRFEQAIRLEGTKIAQSKHASGLVVSPVPLNNICPMVLDTKSKTMIAGMEMEDLENLGLIKFDILGLALLDKIDGIRQILATGDIYDY